MTDNEHRLYRALLSLQNEEECERFLKDVCTVKEVEDLSSRLLVARLLSEGVPYNDIAHTTGASTATISRVSKCLSRSDSGYRMVLPRIADLEADPANCKQEYTISLPNTPDGIEIYEKLCQSPDAFPELEGSFAEAKLVYIDPQDTSSVIESGLVDLAIVGEWDAIEQGLHYTPIASLDKRKGFGLCLFNDTRVPAVATMYPSLLESYARSRGLRLKAVSSRADRRTAEALFDGYFGEVDFNEAKRIGQLEYGYCKVVAQTKKI